MKYSQRFLNLSHIMQNHRTTDDFLSRVDSTLVHKKSWESLSVIWKIGIFSRLSAKSTRPKPSSFSALALFSLSPHPILLWTGRFSLHNHDSLLFVLFDVHSIPRSSPVQSGGREILSNFHSACFSMWFSSHSEVKKVKHKKAHH